MFWHRIILSDSDDAARSLYNAIDWSANRVIVPAAVTVLAMGITLVAVREAWAFSDLWVILALVLFAISAFGFGTWTDKLFAAALSELDDGGITSAGYRQAAQKPMGWVVSTVFLSSPSSL